MKNTRPKIDKAKKLVESLVKLSDDQGLKLRAMQILERMSMPMRDVLNKVPGGTVVDRCKVIGIARQTYYSWARGASRPNGRQSKRLAELTGFDWQDINGRTRLTPPKSKSKLSAPSP